MALPELNNSTYYAARQRLTLAARANALDVIRRVQMDGLRIALLAGLPEEACRLMKTDVTQAVLAKDALRMAALPDYAELASVEGREEALEAGLTGTLLTWVASRLERPLADRLFQAYLDHLLQSNPGDAA